MDQQPVLAITGMQYNDVTGTFGQQDVELDKLFMDVAVYNERVMSAAHMEPVADLAIRSAIDKRGVAHITIPIDVQQEPVKQGRSKRNRPHHTSAQRAIPGNVPSMGDLKEAAAILNDGRRVAILAGQGALHDLKNVVLHHPRLVADGHNDVPLGELRHTQSNRLPVLRWWAPIAINFGSRAGGSGLKEAVFPRFGRVRSSQDE